MPTAHIRVVASTSAFKLASVCVCMYASALSAALRCCCAQILLFLPSFFSVCVCGKFNNLKSGLSAIAAVVGVGVAVAVGAC